MIGNMVYKISGKPFKSRLKINTIKGFLFDKRFNKLAYTFNEDDSFVHCDKCLIIERNEYANYKKL